MSESNPLPIVGYRCWFALLNPWDRWDSSFREEDEILGLRSVGKDTQWHAHEIMQAKCLSVKKRAENGKIITGKPEHPAPDEDCTCGLYAYDRSETAQLYLDKYSGTFLHHMVMGAVLLWGRTFVGDVTTGEAGYRYRAEFGKIIALRKDGPRSEAIAKAFNIPLVSGRYLESFAKEHGEHHKPAA